jgi:hypothetical protein
VTAPRHADQKGHNGTWRVLAELSVPSEPGNERLAMERVAEVVPFFEFGEATQLVEHLNRRLEPRVRAIRPRRMLSR